ncbi:MAG: hypothetical protein M0R80_03825 [Proteobacteria bacterium]|jgi:hypothetical protein|nr:hypothetical protein [Pseudomonadota bacterium]
MGEVEMLNGLIGDGNISNGTLTTVTVIPLDRLMLYLWAYDERYEEYPEHTYEGEFVKNWILECALGDDLINKEEFDKYFTELDF